MPDMDSLLRDLVVANRALAQEGVVDAFGHVSARHPENPDRFLLSRAIAPEQVHIDDIMEFNLDGEPIDRRGRDVHGERLIHAAMYESRADVMAVCHNHSPAVLPFGITEQPLRAVTHMTSLIGPEVPVWDIATEFGPTDLMVTSLERGRSLARTLGGATAVLMRGHGCVVVGGSVPEVVMTSVYLQLDGQLVMQARAMGTVQYLTPEEVDLASKFQRRPGPIAKAWGYWRSRTGFDAE